SVVVRRKGCLGGLRRDHLVDQALGDVEDVELARFVRAEGADEAVEVEQRRRLPLPGGVAPGDVDDRRAEVAVEVGALQRRERRAAVDRAADDHAAAILAAWVGEDRRLVIRRWLARLSLEALEAFVNRPAVIDPAGRDAIRFGRLEMHPFPGE